MNKRALRITIGMFFLVFLIISFVSSYANRSELMLEFTGLAVEQREELIVKLYTGKYDNEIHETGTVSGIVLSLFRRAFGKERT